MLWWMLCAWAGPRDALVTPADLPAWATESGSEKVEGPWWSTLEDPGLPLIMEAAIAANRDLLAASERTDATRAANQQTWATILPSVSFDANASLSPTASRGFQFGGFGSVPGAPEPPKTFWTGQAAFTGAWEPDVFGKNLAGLQASRHDTHAARGDRDAQVLAFASRVAEGYFDVVAAGERLAIVERQVTATQQLLEIVELRYQAGDATAVDLLQQRQQAAGSAAQLPLARAQLTSLKQQLAVALSLPPATVVEGVATSLPELPPVPDAGVPADLVLSRPDLRAAEARLDAATSRKNNAVRQLLPTVRISGQAGWQFFDETEFKSQSFWSAGASVSVPIFQGGRNHSAVASARHAESANVHAYTQLAANAVLEVENALVLERERALHYEAIRAQEEAARLTFEEAREQYERGVGNYLALLTAQTTHQTAELALLDSHRQRLSARVALHDALGGSWPTEFAVRLGDAP